MMRRITALVLSVALVIAVWMIPSTAADFKDAMFFNADYTAESLDDKAGSVAYRTLTSGGATGTVPFVEDSTTGGKVASFNGSTAVWYGASNMNLYSKLQSDFTMEAYFKLKDNPTNNSWGFLFGTFWLERNNSTGFGIGYNTGVGLGSGSGELSYTVGNGGQTSTKIGAVSPNEWVHIVYVHTGTAVNIYLNGELKLNQPATPIANRTDRSFRVGGYNDAGQFATKMECAYVRMYEDVANAENVADLYAGRNGQPAVTPTEEPTPVPTEEPTPTEEQPTPTEEQPTPTEAQPTPTLPELPEGPAYQVVAEDVPAFKAGDQVDITFKITDIEDPEGLLGVDLDIVYDYTLLKPLKNDNGRAIVKSSASEIMSKYENSKWTGTSRLDGEDTEMPTYELHLFSDAEVDSEEPQVDVAIKEDGELWFTISFEALADGEPDTLLAYTVSADGTDSNVEGVQGTGTFAFVAAQEEPSEEPSDEPTEVPTEPSATTPVPDDDKPGNTVTFDAGLISLAAVALSSVVAVKKKRF